MACRAASLVVALAVVIGLNGIAWAEPVPFANLDRPASLLATAGGVGADAPHPQQAPANAPAAAVREPLPWVFTTTPNRWLQARAVAPVTMVMNVVSLLGYTVVYMAAAVVMMAAWRARTGAALLLLLALTSMANNGLKTALQFPRPDAVDSQVRNLSLIAPSRVDSRVASGDSPVQRVIDSVADVVYPASRTRDGDDSVFGFPSGHVSSATAFCLGLIALCRWRRGWIAAVLWIPAMALSRMYLGRHFLVDVAGGVVVATAVTVLAVTLLRLADAARADGTRDPVALAWRLGVVTSVVMALALAFGSPGAREAGRLLGIAVGAAVLAFAPAALDSTARGARVVRVAVVLIVYGAAAWATGRVAEAASLDSRFAEIVRSAIPLALMLTVPRIMPGAPAATPARRTGTGC